MRVALISYEYPFETACGGIGTYVYQQARMLSESGHSVEVFTASGKRAGWKEDGNLRINFVLETDTQKFSKLVAPVFRERHSTLAFDVVESPEYNADGREVLQSHPKVAHVVKLHTPTELLREIGRMPLETSEWLRHQASQARMALGALRRGWRPLPYKRADAHFATPSAIEPIERNYARECDFVVSPSRALLDWAILNWALDPKHSIAVPYPYIPSQALLDIGFREKGKVVGYFGRLESRKGITDLVEAIPQILKAEPDTRFRLVGRALPRPGSQEPFDAYVRRKLWRHMNRIDIAGSRSLEEMPGEYSQVDVCVFPSVWENFPNVCLEAMSAGRAIVGSSAGGMAEMLEGERGILIPPRSPKKLADAVIQFIRNPELRLMAGKRSRQRVLGTYSTAAVLPLALDSYESAIAANRNRRSQ